MASATKPGPPSGTRPNRTRPSRARSLKPATPKPGTPKSGTQPQAGHGAIDGEATAPVEQNIVPACCTSVRRTRPFGVDRFGVDSAGPVVR